jgi:hypothetical protein
MQLHINYNNNNNNNSNNNNNNNNNLTINNATPFLQQFLLGELPAALAASTKSEQPHRSGRTGRNGIMSVKGTMRSHNGNGNDGGVGMRDTFNGGSATGALTAENVSRHANGGSGNHDSFTRNPRAKPTLIQPPMR